MEEAALAQLSLSKLAATSSLEAPFLAAASLMAFWAMLRGRKGREGDVVGEQCVPLCGPVKLPLTH